MKKFTHNDYEVISREVLYEGVFRMVRLHLKHKLFNGNWGDVISREVMERKSAVAVLPYDPILDKVVLIEQFRPGCLSKPDSPWLIETVAGVYDGEESSAEVAYRETEEEAGCKVLDLQPIYEYFVSPGGSNEHLALYCARVDASVSGGLFGLAQENEDIRAFAISVDEALELLKNGSINTSPPIIALQWLQLNREWLRKLWQTN